MFDQLPSRFPDSMTLAEARADFFATSGLGSDGGYSARWVRVETRPAPVYFPNTACRVAAAKLHDLHHIAMEYAVDWTGEAEIAGWEIASGCGRHGWAWILNLGAFTVGLVRSPRSLFRAFVRGRRAATNLYHAGIDESELNTVTVGELRRRLGRFQSPPPVQAADILAFAFWAVAGLGWHVSLAMVAAICGYFALRTAGWL
jgi:hypothetical protein